MGSKTAEMEMEMELPSCSLLDKMSAELRNTIYQLTFTLEHDEGEKVRLFESKPPTKDVLLSCRQVYIEAKGYYIEAFRKYWRTTEFTISSSELERKSIELSDIKGQDVDKITKLGIWEEHADPAFMCFKYVLDHGVWTMGNQETPPSNQPQEYNNGLVVFSAAYEKPDTIRVSLTLRLDCAGGPRVLLHHLVAILIWSFDEDKSNKIHKEAIPIEWLPQWK